MADAGMIGGIISAVGGVVKGVAGGIVANKARKNLNKTLANAPKYKINQEAFDNQAIARGQAYGRNTAIQMGQENNDAAANNAANQARDVSSSSSALMNAIQQIQSGRNAANRGLAIDDASIRQQNVQNLQNVNNQMIDEKDKAWEYNVNTPFQNRVAQYRDQFTAARQVQMSS